MNAIELLLSTDDEKKKGLWLSRDERNSEFKRWYDKRLKEHSNYKDNKRTGEYKIWSWSGGLAEHLLYEQDKIIKDLLAKK